MKSTVAQSGLRLFSLFFSKTGAILVGILFLPVYHDLLGDDEFGSVAVIVSLQAFALMVDMGMSVLLSRDVARGDSTTSSPWRIYVGAELAVAMTYAFVGFIAMAGASLGPGRSMSVVSGCVLLCLATVLQNLAQVALLARRHFVAASTIQVSGVLIRAAVTVAALKYGSAGVLMFVWVQAAAATSHWLVTRHYCAGSLNKQAAGLRTRPWQDAWLLVKRGRPIFAASLAGAAATQLDKPLLSVFLPHGEIAPYFLAMSVAILPTSVLASPLVQYFQSKLISLPGSVESEASRVEITRFTTLLMVIVAFPSWVFWQWADLIISLWLHKSALSGQVAGYVRLLLPAFTLASLCYVPVILLQGAQDFRYQAVVSIALTGVTLSCVAAAGAMKRVDWVCYAYIFYFAASSASVWTRALLLPATRAWAHWSARKTVIPLSALVLGSSLASLMIAKST